jgi:hypothetical protein
VVAGTIAPEPEGIRPVVDTPPDYLCVFYADEATKDDVRDLGQDPDFSDPPTWGICRPNVRRAVQRGSYVLFIGYLRISKIYLVKGWLRVGQKISYLDALDRYPERLNVIVRESSGRPSRRRATWYRPKYQLEAERRFGTDPAWLGKVRVGERILVQNPDDEHEIDNWKCNRIFMCRTRQFERCLHAGACQRELEFPDFRTYVVADQWHDAGRRLLRWDEVAPPRWRGEPLRTRYGQHNTRLLTRDEVRDIRETLGTS